MTSPRSPIVLALLALLLSITPRAARAADDWRDGRDPGLLALLDEVLEANHERFPESVGPAIGDESLNHRLTDSSPGAWARWRERQADWLARAKAMDLSGADEVDRLDRDLLVYRLDVAARTSALWREQTPISSMGGPQVWLPQMGGRVPMSTQKHRVDYARRLEAVPNAIGDAIDQMRAGMDAGRVPPRVTVEPAVPQVLAQVTDSIRADPTRSPFYSPFLGDDDETAARARRAIADGIVPAFTELALFLQNEYLPATRETTAIADSIDGPGAYDIAIRQHTTLDLTADGVHQTGLDEVARIKREMMEVIARSDWPGNDESWTSDDDRFAAFVGYLRTADRFYVETEEELLTAYRVASKVIDAEMPALFGLLPRLPYGVRPIPRFAARAAPTAFYYSGSLEGGVPGYFMANTHALDQRPLYDVVALTLHEGVPGHHHQIAIAQELEGVHPIRRLSRYTAFSEGWGLYAERLGLEMGHDDIDDGVDRGLYADPYDDFGRLNFEMWRALRLVVDTGLHAKGWSRQRAIDFMGANSALTETNIANEVDRYIGWPGQALAYKIGQLKILELRSRAERALGEAFDVRGFHDAVLDTGALPLPVLEAKIDRWIERMKDR